jgi:hypothetical protein
MIVSYIDLIIYVYTLKIERFVLLWNKSAAGSLKVKFEDFCIVPLGSSIMLSNG